MVSKKDLLIETGIVAIFISWWWFFVSTNVNPVLGNIYTNITLGAIAIAMIDYFFGSKVIKLINPNVSWVKAFTLGVIGYIILLFSGQLAVRFAEVIPVTELLQLLASSAPVFSQSAIINFLTFGVVVAYIESYAFFVVGYDLLASMFNVEISKRSLTNPKSWMIIFGISLMFLFLHITSKGIESEATLILVFLMAVISLVMVTIYRDARIPIIIHVLANSIASTALFSATI